VIANNIIRSNSASSSGLLFYGAGIYCYYGHAQITGNTIISNQFPNSTSQGEGGGIYSINSYPTISGNVIRGNAAYSGSAIYATATPPSTSTPLITGNIIQSNSMAGAPETQSGAITLSSCQYFDVDNNLIEGNLGVYGGGINIGSPAGYVRNNLILDNQTMNQSSYGAGLYASIATGAIYIYNNTFAGNISITPYSGDSGAMFFHSLNTNTVVANNIFAFNSGGLGTGGSSLAPTLLNNCFWNNTNGNYLTNVDLAVNLHVGILIPSAPNIVTNPLFMNVTNLDFHLTNNSPCIDAGAAVTNVPTTDYDGVARPLDGLNHGVAKYDIGAYEYVNPLADTDHDGMPDWAEIVAGTNPTDATSYLRLQSHGLGVGNGVALDWQSVTGRIYSIQFKPSLNGAWQVLSNNIAGSGAMMEVQDSPLTRSNRCYRIGVTNNLTH